VTRCDVAPGASERFGADELVQRDCKLLDLRDRAGKS
jgi:hypothetical protein